jgi:hypothetical protein
MAESVVPLELEVRALRSALLDRYPQDNRYKGFVEADIRPSWNTLLTYRQRGFWQDVLSPTPYWSGVHTFSTDERTA